MDKEWMKLKDRGAPQYLNGIDNFLDFAFNNSSVDHAGNQIGTKIRCPCCRCANVHYKTRSEVRFDLLRNGILQSYIVWDKHGEDYNDVSLESEANTDCDGDVDEEMLDMLQVGCGVAGMGLLGGHDRGDDDHSEEAQEPSGEAARFYRLLRDYKDPLVVDGSKVSKLVYIMKLLHLKCLNHWTDTSFTQLLKFQNEVLGSNLLDSYDACRKIIADLGLNYIKIDACPNDCIIYWREHVDAQECLKCHTSRWKTNGKNVPNKLLRYFPIKPRLQKLFMSTKTAKEMRWHKEERINDENVMQHPADSPTWKAFDKEFKSFANDPRSVRLGLAADGFQPFNNFGGSCHSIWPIVLTPYNLPPWMCMKPPYIFLSLLIDGPNSPGMDLDVIFNL